MALALPSTPQVLQQGVPSGETGCPGQLDHSGDTRWAAPAPIPSHMCGRAGERQVVRGFLGGAYGQLWGAWWVCQVYLQVVAECWGPSSPAHWFNLGPPGVIVFPPWLEIYADVPLGLI